MRLVGNTYVKAMCRREYKMQNFSQNKRAIEYAFALRSLYNSTAETVLDVGSGLSPWPALLRKCGYVVTAIDEVESYWRRTITNRHFYVIKDDITNPRLSKTFDFITCIGTLEHICDHRAAMRGMFKLLKGDHSPINSLQ